MKRKIRLLSQLLLIILIFQSCHEQKKKTDVSQEKDQGIIEHSIQYYEKLLPSSVSDTNHVVIWRDGSIFFCEYASCLIIDKRQLKDDKFLCYYFAFNHKKTSNWRNGKLAIVYELTLKNQPFKFPLKERTVFTEIDSLCFETHSEGIEANVYFMKDFNSDVVYPIHKKYNKSLIKNIEFLFKQISKKEHVQTLSLFSDSVDYNLAYRLMKSDSITYCVTNDGEAEYDTRPF